MDLKLSQKADECSGRVTRVCLVTAAPHCPAGVCWCCSWTCLVQFPCLWAGMRAVCVHFSTVPVAGSVPKERCCSPSWACLITLEPLMSMDTQWTRVPVAAVGWGCLSAPPYSQNKHKSSTISVPVFRVISGCCLLML